MMFLEIYGTFSLISDVAQDVAESERRDAQGKIALLRSIASRSCSSTERRCPLRSSRGVLDVLSEI